MKNGKSIHDELIEKVLMGEATSQEMKQLAETDTVKHIMRKQWKEGVRRLDEKTGSAIWGKVEERCGIKTKRIIPATLWKWTAACAAIVLIAGSLWFTHSGTGAAVIEYEDFLAEQHATLMLPDSSKIWMQPGSSVRYAKTFDKTRDVWLNGDATFEVSKNQGSPFRVYINEAFVEVKGTVFRVQARESKQSEITLLTGLIDFHIQEKGETIEMKPGQRATLFAGGEVKLEEIESAIGWQNGRYKFVDTRLDVLAGIISHLYDIEVILDSGVPHHYLFNGSIRYDELPSEVIQRICYNMSLEYRKEQEKIIVYRP